MKVFILIGTLFLISACGGSNTSPDKVYSSGDINDIQESKEMTSPDLSFMLPQNIANGCEFNVQVNDANSSDISAMSWYVSSENSDLIAQGKVVDGSINSLSIPVAGNYTLMLSAQYGNGLVEKFSNEFFVNKALPKDIRSVNYVIQRGDSQFLCHEVNIWSDATLTMEHGSSLYSIDNNSKKIFMWGDINISGESNSRILVSDIVFENDFSSTETSVLVNATYVDFIKNATIKNDQGTTNINYSSFDSHFYQEDKGTIKHNVFKKGLSIKPDGTVIKNNDIFCDGLEMCMLVNFYGFGGTFLNAIPTIENNNFYNPAKNSITYKNDSFTQYDINLRNNYWGGMTSTELDDVFFDANDTPYKSHRFLYAPTLINKVEDINLLSDETDQGDEGSETNSNNLNNETKIDKTEVKLFGKKLFSADYEELMTPYSSSGVVNANIIGSTIHVIEKFKILAVGRNFTIVNLIASDISNRVSPFFDGLSNNTILSNGVEVEFKLVSPLTGGAITELLFSFEVLETGEKFTVTRTFKSN